MKEKEDKGNEAEKRKSCFVNWSGDRCCLLLKTTFGFSRRGIGVKQTVFNTQELELPRSLLDVGF